MYLTDRAEALGKTISKLGRGKTGMSTFHWLTLASIGTSIGLFIAGKKQLALFVGLWPPTFQAIRASMK
jgi:hypothetical protein